MRDTNRLQVLHRALQFPAGYCLITFKSNLPDLNLRALFHYEGQANGCRGNGPDFGGYRGKLAAVCSQQFLNYDFGTLDLGRIVLTLLGKSDFALLKLIQYVALRDRIQTDILDLSDRWLFFHVDVNDPALGGWFPLNAQIIEIAGIPQRVEVTFQRRLIVNITRPGKHALLDGVSRDPPVAVDDNLDNHVALLSRAHACEQENREDKANRSGTAAGPANQRPRESYLKMARNDANLNSRLMKAQLYGTHATRRNPATSSSSTTDG